MKRIAIAIEKKYRIDEANSYIDEIFAKYYQQYEKKKKYDENYFGKNKKLEEENRQLRNLVYKLKQQKIEYANEVSEGYYILCKLIDKKLINFIT